jgi:outer membrane lipase/esterase
MKQRRVAVKSINLLALSLSIAVSAQAHAGGFSTFYVFGDSLVDAGNISLLTSGAVPPAAAGYFQGRFTNGLNYPDLLSINEFGTPTVASLAGGNNFAFGGARVVANGDTVPDLSLQLGAFNARTGGVADPNALYILTLGGNDVFALGTNDIGALTPTQYGDAVVTQYSDSVRFLNSLGAKNILITGIPNGGNPTAVALDAQLQVSLDALTLLPGTNLYRYSFLNFFNTVFTNPASLGLPVLRNDTTCLRARTPSPNIDCTGFFLFDDVHPTAAVQAAAARDINRQFNLVPAAPVPEPSTWALLISGFGLIGAALRRARTPASAGARSA